MVSSAAQRQYAKKKFVLKPRHLIFVGLFVFAWVLFGFNYSNADYSNYEFAYNEIKEARPNGYFEIGFYLLIRLAAVLGINYQGFLIIISAVCLLIFVNALKHLTANVNLAFAFYLVYPFVFDIVQYRNFLAFSFVLYGLHYLLNKNSKSIKNVLKYFAFVILGALFHSSVVVYALLFLVVIKRTKILTLITCILFATLVFLIINQDILFALLNLLHLERFARYTVDYAYSTFIQYCAVYCFFLIFALYKFRNDRQSPKLKLLILSAVFLPFIIINGTGARFIRNIFVLFYAFLLDNKGKRIIDFGISQVITMFAVLAAILFVFYSQLGSGLYYEIVLKPVFKYNLFFGKKY